MRVVNHVGLCVTDLDRSRRFYEEALGFSHRNDLAVRDRAASRLLQVPEPVGLTAVYLTLETDDRELQDDFRRRAFVSGVVVGGFALGSALAARAQAPQFFARLIGSAWSWPLQIATGAIALASFHALYRRYYRRARVLAAAQVALILAGWGAAQYPHLIAPDLTIHNAAAPPVGVARESPG